MRLVGLHFIMDIFQFDTGLEEHVLRLGTSMVLTLADHAPDTTVDDEHAAYTAWGHTAVESRTVKCYTILGSLADGILLGVDGAHTVLCDGTIFMYGLLHLVAYIITVW